MAEEFQPLSIHEYANDALTTDQRSDDGSLSFPLLGLFGEVGSLLSEVKKKHRDRASYIGYAASVVEEFGDVLWYLNLLASRAGLTLTDIAARLGEPSPTRATVSGSPLLFASLQPAIMPPQAEPTKAFERTLLRLAGEVGRLVTDYETGRLSDAQQALRAHLVAIIRTLLQAATEAGITLEAAAVKNRYKIFDRWPRDRVYRPLLDFAADPEEQLPRLLHIEIFERTVHGQNYVYQRCKGINIGDRLTDNALTPDDYRFHDVFHYAYVAVLGWSPVMRSLFRLKRKSDPMVDDAEDGARAMLIEEGVTTWIFGQARELNFFADVKRGELPLSLLKHVRQFVSGFEPDGCPLWLWEDAIINGYAAFRFLREHRRGRIYIDAENRRLTVAPMP